MQTANLERLRLSSLPSINLLGAESWQAVRNLPESPGIYCVVCTAANRPNAQLTQPLIRLARKIFTTKHLAPIIDITSRGSLAEVNLYVGMSGNLRKRWWAKDKEAKVITSPHHKRDDLRLASYVLNTVFDVTSLRLHYGITRDRETAMKLEDLLIAIHEPVLNGLAPIAKADESRLRVANS